MNQQQAKNFVSSLLDNLFIMGKVELANQFYTKDIVFHYRDEVFHLDEIRKRILAIKSCKGQEMTNLIAAWEFVQSTAKDASGNQLPDPINDAKGMLIYTDTQCISVQLYIPDKKYIAYYGYYKFDFKDSIVTHKIVGTTSPALMNRSVERKVKFYDKDYISLTNTSPEKIDMEFQFIVNCFGDVSQQARQ